MFLRLPAHTFANVDHEQHRVDAGGSRDHRAHVVLVAGDVDEIHGALGKLEPREARHDGQPPRLLLGQPVGVDAGERPHEARLAVVDVTDDADRALLHRNAASSDATSAATSPAATVRISSRNASRWTRPTTAGRWARHARASSRAERPSTLTRRATLGNV